MTNQLPNAAPRAFEKWAAAKADPFIPQMATIPHRSAVYSKSRDRNISTNSSKPESPTPGKFLLRWDELHAWQKDNQYILAHYRPASYSYYVCFQSIFFLHNESVNIHTHLLGALVFLFITLIAYAFTVHIVSGSDILAFGCFVLGAVFCLSMSATFHAISNHSPLVNRLGNQLDYAGIVALIVGSFVPSIYYGFYCEPVLQRVYWAMASLKVTIPNIISKK